MLSSYPLLTDKGTSIPLPCSLLDRVVHALVGMGAVRTPFMLRSEQTHHLTAPMLITEQGEIPFHQLVDILLAKAVQRNASQEHIDFLLRIKQLLTPE